MAAIIWQGQKPAKVSWENPWRMGQSQIAEHNRRKGKRSTKLGICHAHVLHMFWGNWDLSWARSCRYGLGYCCVFCKNVYFRYLSVFCASVRCGVSFFFQIAFAVRFLLQVDRGCCSGCRYSVSLKLWYLAQSLQLNRAARVHSDSAEIRPSEPDQGYLEAIADVSMNGGRIV